MVGKRLHRDANLRRFFKSLFTRMPFFLHFLKLYPILLSNHRWPSIVYYRSYRLRKFKLIEQFISNSTKRKTNYDKDNIYKLLRLSVDKQTRNNKVMVEAASELKTRMIEQATVLVNRFKDVMKSLLENKKYTLFYLCYFVNWFFFFFFLNDWIRKKKLIFCFFLFFNFIIV